MGKLISTKTIIELARKYDINTRDYPIWYLQKGASVELEHADIFGPNPDTAFRIALDHLKEFPDYYAELSKMEERLSNRWRNRHKPNLFRSDK